MAIATSSRIALGALIVANVSVANQGVYGLKLNLRGADYYSAISGDLDMRAAQQNLAEDLARRRLRGQQRRRKHPVLNKPKTYAEEMRELDEALAMANGEKLGEVVEVKQEPIVVQAQIDSEESTSTWYNQNGPLVAAYNLVAPYFSHFFPGCFASADEEVPVEATVAPRVETWVSPPAAVGMAKSSTEKVEALSVAVPVAPVPAPPVAATAAPVRGSALQYEQWRERHERATLTSRNIPFQVPAESFRRERLERSRPVPMGARGKAQQREA